MLEAVMADLSLTKVAVALGGGIVVAAGLGLLLGFLAERRHGNGLFAAFFLTLVCVYALGFAARYYLVEVLP